MSFLTPPAFALLGLLVPLFLLYFLKVRRQRRPVPSTLLWRPALRDQQAAAFFQRLQKDPLLILQLLALVALVVALARPAVTIKGQGADSLVLIMDVSASMKARDVAPSRFHAAQRRALALIDGMRKGGEVMVIEAAPQPKVWVPFTRDRDRARKAVAAMAPRDTPNHLQEAIRTAVSLFPQSRPIQIHALTDGAFDAGQAPEFRDPRVRWVAVGQRGRNVGITGLTLRRTYYGVYEHQAFLSLVNFSQEPMAFPLKVSIDGRPVSEQAITLGPQVKRSVIVPFTHQGGGTVRVEIGADDDLAVDNVAYGIIPPPRVLKVLLVTPGNLFLEKALRADPQVALEVKTPDGYQGGMAGFDVVVLDNAAPSKIGAGRFVLVNTLAADVPLENLGILEQPVILDWDRQHPVMRFVDLSKVTVEQAMRVRPLAAGKAIMEAVGGPLLYLLEEPSRKVVFVGFDLFKTDLPLRVAFPLILSNSLRWLSPVGLEGSDLMVQAGTPFLLPVEHGVEEARVRARSGEEWKVPITRGLLSFAQTDRVGLYSLLTGKGEVPFAVNLLSEGESNTLPQPLPQPAAAVERGGELFQFQRELWGTLLWVALVLLALEGLLYWRRQTAGRWAMPGRWADRWALGLRIFILLLLGLSLTTPQFPRWVDRQNVLFLLDYSDSISLAAREAAYRFVTQALGGMREDDRAGAIVFGAEARLVEPLQPKPTFRRPEISVPGKGTDIEEAIQLALASMPPGEANRIVLLSDGRENIGRAVAAAQAAGDRGVELYYAPLPLPFAQEVVVEQLLLPTEAKFGEPFYARVVVSSGRETAGRLSLYRNGEFLGSQMVRLTPGKNVFTYRQALEQSGVHVYQAHLEAEADTIEENNRAVGTTVVRGKPLVLYVEKDRAQAQSLVAALRAQHIDVDLAGPDGLPKTLAGLQKYDGVILSNVSSLKLTQGQMGLVRDYVRDHGGGFVMLGGEESFGLGGYYRTPIEEALPVTMEVKQKVEIPSLAVMLVLDRSGSMAMSTEDRVTKLDVAKEAAHLVVELLDERNEVGVLSFDTEFTWVVPITQAKDKEAISHEVASIRAGGGTDGYPALKEAYRALYERQAILKHVIFLSDGQMTRGDFAGLVRRMAKDKITVSAVAIGKDADVQLMYDIAKWGKGRFYYTEDTLTIPRIFTLETQLASKSSLVEQPFRPVLATPYHEVVQDIDWSKAPPLGGYVATSLKGSAEMLLMTHQEDPLLAVWQYGLGRAAAFTADAKPKWGILWLRWKDFGRFWAQTIRWTLRTGTRSDTTATVVRRDGQGVVTVEAVDAKGEFINFLEAQLGVVAPDKSQTAVSLEQVAPGRYRAVFPAEEEGVYLVGLAQRKGQQMVGSQIVGLVVPYAQEFRELGPNEAFLREVSELTGGGALAAPKDAFELHRRRSRLAVDLWPWLVGFATFLLIPEIALRRLGPAVSTAWRGLRRGRSRGEEGRG